MRTVSFRTLVLILVSTLVASAQGAPITSLDRYSDPNLLNFTHQSGVHPPTSQSHAKELQNGRVSAVTPSDSSCTYSVAPTSLQAPVGGGDLTVNVQTTTSCSWTISGLPSWITVSGAPANSSGTATLIGPAAVTLAVSPNSGAARSTTISIAGASVIVTQPASPPPPPCTYSVSPTSSQASATGDDLIVSIQTTSSCYWAISGLPSWVTASGFPLAGPSSFILVVAPNFGNPRSATITVAGVSLIVSQPAAVAASPAQAFTTLVSFKGTDGALPFGSLKQGTDGNFYGTTSQGGLGSCSSPPVGCGTVFKMTPGGTLTTLHNFNTSDGANPIAGLIQATDGNFYGTTTAGGITGSGTIFKITPSGILTTLHSFDSRTEGQSPSGLIQATDGNFYGTTSAGPSNGNGYGTVFKTTAGGTLTTLHSFNNSDGVHPMAGLIQGTDGNLYGTTLQSYVVNGRYGGFGTVFKITLGGTLTTLHSFGGGDGGAYPFTRLVQATDGNFYGIAFGGGWGTIFKIASGGTFGILHSFNYTDGGYAIIGGVYPHGGLIQGADGNLYATTTLGGAGLVYGVAAGGTIFQITMAGALTTVYSIRGIDGTTLHGDLIQGTDGKFYATASQDGAYNDGTVFSFAPPAALTASPASLSFSYQVPSPNLPQSQALTVAASSAVPFTAVASGGSWLTVNPTSGTTPANLSVSVNPAGLSPGTYTGKIIVTVQGASTSPFTVSIAFTISAVSITSISAAGGGSDITQNTWIEIKGTGLAPDDLGPNGFSWSTAPEFNSGKMPTQLRNVKVTVNGKAAYVYWISPTQVNVLTPLDSTKGNVQVQLTNGVDTSAPFAINMKTAAPAFLLIGASMYIAGQHADYTLLGPESLSVPGFTFTPATPGETVILYGNGFGLPATNLVEGSATQFGTLPSLPTIQIGGGVVTATSAYLISPGLYQINAIVPVSTVSGDIAVTASYAGFTTPLGAKVRVQ